MENGILNQRGSVCIPNNTVRINKRSGIVPELYQPPSDSVSSEICIRFLKGQSNFFENPAGYRTRVRYFLQAFSRAGLHLKLGKSEFHNEVIKYLRLIIGRGEVKIEYNKVEPVQI